MELTSGQSQQAGSIAETEAEEEEAREAWERYFGTSYPPISAM